MKTKRVNASFRFRSEDLEKWKAAAKQDSRSLTNWIEVILNQNVRGDGYYLHPDNPKV